MSELAGSDSPGHIASNFLSGILGPPAPQEQTRARLKDSLGNLLRVELFCVTFKTPAQRRFFVGIREFSDQSPIAECRHIPRCRPRRRRARSDSGSSDGNSSDRVGGQRLCCRSTSGVESTARCPMEGSPKIRPPSTDLHTFDRFGTHSVALCASAGLVAPPFGPDSAARLADAMRLVVTTPAMREAIERGPAPPCGGDFLLAPRRRTAQSRTFLWDEVQQFRAAEAALVEAHLPERTGRRTAARKLCSERSALHWAEILIIRMRRIEASLPCTAPAAAVAGLRKCGKQCAGPTFHTVLVRRMGGGRALRSRRVRLSLSPHSGRSPAVSSAQVWVFRSGSRARGFPVDETAGGDAPPPSHALGDSRSWGLRDCGGPSKVRLRRGR